MKCPNTSHPDWKKLVELIGEDATWDAYVAHGENIPSADFYEKALAAGETVVDGVPMPSSVRKAYQDVVIPGFTVDSQDNAVTFITEQVMAYIRDTPELTFNQAILLFNEWATKKIAAGDTIFQPILENLPQFRQLVKDRLDRIGLLETTKIDPKVSASEGILIENEGTEPETLTDTFYWKDDWSFSFDTKISAQLAIKRFLTFIPKMWFDVNGDPNVTMNPYGTISYMPFDQIFEELKGILADTNPSWDLMYNKLVDLQDSKPWVYSLLTQLDPTSYKGDFEQLKNQFVSTFSSTYNNFKTVLRDRDTGGFKIIDTDQDSVLKTILNRWTDGFRNKNFYEYDYDTGEIKTDQDVVKRTLAAIGKLKELKVATEEEQAAAIPQVKKVLDSLGIELSDRTLGALIAGYVTYSFDEHFVNSDGLFKLIIKRLRGADKDIQDVESTINPMVNNSAVRKLAEYESRVSDVLFSNSTRNGQNNVVYSYSYNKYMTMQLRRLLDPEYAAKLQEITFQKPVLGNNKKPLYTTWLQLFETSQTFRENFTLAPFDTLKEPSSNGKKLSELDDNDHDLVKLQVFLAQKTTNAIGFAHYLFTVPDKTTSYLVQAPTLSVAFSDNGEFNKASKDAAYSIALTELQRINSAIKRKLVTNKYKDGATLFYFFPQLNKKANPDIWNTDGTVKEPTTIVNGRTVESIIREVVENSLKASIDQQLSSWTEAGFIVDDRVVGADPTMSPREVAANYVVNYTMFKFNMHQTFIGDPALYYKASKNTALIKEKGEIAHVAETWDDLGKRLAAQIAPGRDVATTPGETFISVKVKDAKLASKNLAQLQKRLGDLAKPYEGIDTTDAQEFTTVKEHLHVLYGGGLLDTETYNRLSLKAGKEDFSKEELKLVFQPMKPVYANTMIDAEQDAVIMEYVKSSSIPLIPQFTKGLEIDKLRTKMEKLEAEKKVPVRLAFMTATKVGGVAPASVFDEEGRVKDDFDLSKHYVELPREGFRIQQDVPYDRYKEETVKATQPTKLLFDGLLGESGFNYRGQALTGAGLKEIWNKLHGDLLSYSRDSLMREITDGAGNLNIQKVVEVLRAEAKKRGWSPAEIASLTLNESGTDLLYPFWAINSSTKYESLLTSLFTNNIIKQKMHGKSLVLVTETGFLGKSEGIVYTRNYDPNTGLKPYRIDEATGEVKGAQVLIPWKYKTDINKFIDSEGYLDTSKLPAELLEQFGFRIPNQGHNSMSLLEIVGFLPESMGDAAIAPRDFITQMGSDFDIDKLYIYDHYVQEDTDANGVFTGKISIVDDNAAVADYETWKVDLAEKVSRLEKGYSTKDFEGYLKKKGFTVTQFEQMVQELETTKDEYISKVTLGNIKNQLFDIHKAVLKNPKVFDRVTMPLGNTKDTDEAQEMKKWMQRETNNYLSPLYDRQKYMESVDGKIMVGVESLASTFNTIVQEGKLSLQTMEQRDGKTVVAPAYIIFGKENGKPLYFRDFSNPFDYTGTPKINAIANDQSAAVDNNKDPILYYLNFNPITAPAKLALRQLGVRDEHVIPLLGQPVIREFVKRVKQSRSFLKIGKTLSPEIILDQLIEEEEANFLKGIPAQLVDTEKALAAEYPITAKELKRNLTEPSARMNYISLLKFKEAYTAGTQLRRIQTAISIESGGVGKNIIELLKKQQNFENLKKPQTFPNIANPTSVLGPNVDVLGERIATLSGHVLEFGLNTAYQTLAKENQLFKYSTPAFQTVLTEAQELQGRELYQEEIEALWSNLKSYLFAQQLESKRKDLFFGDNTLADRIKEYMKTPEGATNPFLVRLSFDTSGGKKAPKRIYFQAAKEEYVDELNIFRGFLELSLATDEKARAIGQDLIAYFYVNGGVQRAKEWGKYIHPALLTEFENGTFLDALGNITFDEDAIGVNVNKYSNFITQYYQHNPTDLPVLNTKAKGLKKDKDSMFIPFITQVGGELALPTIATGDYIPMFAVKNQNVAKKREVWVFEGMTDKGYIYKRRSVLGVRGFTEYSRENVAVSLVNARYDVDESKPRPEKETLKNDTPSVAGPILQRMRGKSINKGLDILLSYMEENKADIPTAYFELAKVLKKRNYIGNIEVRAFIGDATGEFNNRTKNIALNTKATLEPARFVRVFLHETIHAATVAAIKQEEGYKITDSQKAALASLRRIGLQVRQRINAGELAESGLYAGIVDEFDKVVAKWQASQDSTANPKLSDTEKAFFDKYKYTLYGLQLSKEGEFTGHEFVTELFTRQDFINMLDSLPYDTNKSLLDRILEVLQQLLALYDIRSNTVAEAAFLEVFPLINTVPIAATATALTTSQIATESTPQPPVEQGEVPPPSPNKSRFVKNKGPLPPDTFLSASETEHTKKKKKKDDFAKRILEQFEDRKRFISKSISVAANAKDFKRVEMLKERLAELETELEEFNSTKSFESIKDLADNDLGFIRKLLAMPSLSHNDLRYAIRTISLWKNINEIIPVDKGHKEYEKRTELLDKISADAFTMEKRWNSAAREAMLDAIKAETGMKHLTQAILDSQDKIDMITGNTMDISRVGNIVLSVMDSWMRESAKRANLELQEILATSEKLLAGLEKNGQFKKDGYFVFAQKTANGELTGELLQPLQAEYYKTRNELLEKARDAKTKQDRKEKWSEYYEWMRNNHNFIDIRKLFKDTDDGYVYAPDQAYLSEIKEQLGEKFDDLLEEQKKKIEYYNEKRKLFISTITNPDNVDPVSGIDPDFVRRFERWRMAHDPAIYLRNVLDGEYSQIIINSEYVRNQGYEFVVKRAKDNWEDKEYNEIQKVPELKAFHDFATNTLNRLYSFLPPSFKDGINNATIPSIAKTLVEKYHEDGFGAAASGLSDKFIEAISVENDEYVASSQDPLTKKPELSLRVRYINSLTPEEKSYDLGKVINVFAQEALMFKHKSVVEDSVLLAQSIIEQSYENVKDPSGKSLVNRFGDTVRMKGGDQLKNMLDYAVKAWYGNRREVQGVIRKKVYTGKAKKNYDQIKAAVERGKFTKDDIALLRSLGYNETADAIIREEPGAMGFALNQVATYLENNTRYVAGSKIGDTLLQYVQMKGMGWNLFGSFTNVAFGWIANFNYASGGRDFTAEHMLKANRLMLAATLKSASFDQYENPTARKINALVKRFDVIKELNEAAYNATSNNSAARRGMEKLAPYELYRRGEYFVQGMTMIATMMNTKVTKDGKEITLWDAFDGDGNYTADGKEQWQGEADNLEHNKEYLKFSNRLDQINKAIHGNYDPNSPVRIKSGILGRALMQFRSWIAEGVAGRFEGEKYDHLLRRTRKGRWRSYFDLGFSGSMKALLSVARGKDMSEFAATPEQVELLKENMKRNLVEIYQWLTLAAVYLLLSNLDIEDDDEWARRSRNYLLNQTLRLQDDIEFYFSPMAMENITQNPIPVTRLIQDTYLFGEALVDGVVNGEWEYQGGTKRGENRVLWRGAKIFPFSSTFSGLINKTEQEEGFRK